MGHRTFAVISAREPKDGRDSKIAVEVDSWRKVNCEEPQPSLHISWERAEFSQQWQFFTIR